MVVGRTVEQQVLREWDISATAVDSEPAGENVPWTNTPGMLDRARLSEHRTEVWGEQHLERRVFFRAGVTPATPEGLWVL